MGSYWRWCGDQQETQCKNLVLAWLLQLTTCSFESSHHDCSTDNTFHQSVYSFKKCFTIHLFPYFNQLFTTPVFPTNTEIPEKCEEFLLPWYYIGQRLNHFQCDLFERWSHDFKMWTGWSIIKQHFMWTGPDMEDFTAAHHWLWLSVVLTEQVSLGLGVLKKKIQ